MRKWKCISGHGKDDFIVGNIYESNDEGYGLMGEDGFVYGGLRYNEFTGAKFEEVFEKDEEKKANKFKVGDKVRIIGNKSSGHKFNIGEIGTIDMICGKGLKDEHCRVASKNKSYYVAYKDMKLATETNLQTFTITVSDSSTTLTSDNETVEIKRYHEDKHDVKVAVNEVVKKYFDEVARANRPTKGKDLIGVEITKGTKFKVINVEPHRDKGYVCLDEYVGKVGSFAKDSFKFTENGYMCSSTFEEDYMNAIDKENGELFWRYDEVEILWEGVDEIN